MCYNNKSSTQVTLWCYCLPADVVPLSTASTRLQIVFTFDTTQQNTYQYVNIM